MPNPGDADVFVVGGGPAGLATAIAARQQGLSVILADAAEGPVDKSCGEGLMPEGIAALRQLEVVIPSQVARFRGIAFHDGEYSAAGTFKHGAAFGIRRTVLHRALFERAVQAGVDCRFGTRVTGIQSNAVVLDSGPVGTRWIVGADGANSRVREWAGLNAGRREGSARRFGFRRHFEMLQPPERVEIYWSENHQVFVTPVGPHEAGVAVLTRNMSIRVDQALQRLPDLRRSLGSPTSSERGATTGCTTFVAPFHGNVALVGDASGTVDAITGEGLAMTFQQAIYLAAAIAAGDLSRYPGVHRRLARAPKMMAWVLLALVDNPILRRSVIRLLASCPAVFDTLLSAHGGGNEIAAICALSRKGAL